MKERPILFTGPMVRALLDGGKTQTRRLVKPAPYGSWTPSVGVYCPTLVTKDGEEYPGPEVFGAFDEIEGRKCPFGPPGDRLWVRETFKVNGTGAGPRVTYHEDRSVRFCPETCPDDCLDWIADDHAWRPSIFMRRYASRVSVEITAVRVERLQSISEADAETEGVGFLRHHPDFDETLTAVQLFKVLWESLNGDGSWAFNPWVWVIEFRRVEA